MLTFVERRERAQAEAGTNEWNLTNCSTCSISTLCVLNLALDCAVAAFSVVLDSMALADLIERAPGRSPVNAFEQCDSGSERQGCLGLPTWR